MAEINVSIDTTELEHRLIALQHIKDGATNAKRIAINKAITGMRTDAKRAVSKRYIVTQTEVSKKINVYKASSSNMTAALRSRGRPIRLAHFRTRDNKHPGRIGASPAFAQVKRNSSGGIIRASSNRSSAFMATYKSSAGSHRGVFVRQIQRKHKKDNGDYDGRLRQPIRQLYAPGVMQMLNHKEVSTKIQDQAIGRYHKELDHQIKQLTKGGAK